MQRYTKFLGFLFLLFLPMPVLGYEEGSLLVFKGSHRIVERWTNSPYTHVAVVLKNEKGLYVYEATKPEGVRKMPLRAFLDMVQKEDGIELYVMNPKHPFTVEQTSIMLEYLKSQMGRKYSILGYIRGQNVEGIHCSELISNMLEKIGVEFDQHAGKIAPIDLIQHKGVLEIYHPVVRVYFIKRLTETSTYQKTLPPFATEHPPILCCL